MSDVQIIALTGKARAGKDTAARCIGKIVQAYNNAQGTDIQDMYITAYESYAAPLKSMTAMLLDFFGLGDISQPETLQPYIDGDKREEIIPGIGVSTRVLLQTLGTEWGRKIINDELWINTMTQRLISYDEVKRHGYGGAIVIITDLRFNNEAEALRQRHKARIIQIDRDEAIDAIASPEHVSEAGVNPAHIDFTVPNNGTPEELLKEVYAVVRDMLPELSPETLEELHEHPDTE